jgi:hypothetical protein
MMAQETEVCPAMWMVSQITGSMGYLMSSMLPRYGTEDQPRLIDSGPTFALG